jgi:pimeloyl-ACP methyl ester carboxylesterase
MDGHGILGLIAPRHAAVATAWQDREGDQVFANEMSMQAASKVYELLGAPTGLKLLYRQGDHHGRISVVGFFDYFDVCFGRSGGGGSDFGLPAVAAIPQPVALSFVSPAGFDWASWAVWAASVNISRSSAPPPDRPLAERIGWLLDTSPTQLPDAFNMGDAWCEEADPGGYISLLMNHVGPAITGKGGPHPKNISTVPFSFGTYITASAFFDTGAIARHHGESAAPVAIWLHGFNYNRGFDTLGNNTGAFLTLCELGYVVVAFDQIGFGMRLQEGGSAFYTRHRHTGGASLLGKMVADVRALVDTLYCFSKEGRQDAKCFRAGSWDPQPQRLSVIPNIDYARLAVVGYSLGGMVALFAAAQDQRISAVCSIAGFTPMRTDTTNRSTGGLKRLSHLHALLPKLGLYIGHEQEVPLDYIDLLAAIAPRPTLLIIPTKDRDATFADVTNCTNIAKSFWNARGDEHALTISQPEDYNRISPYANKTLAAWAEGLAQRPRPGGTALHSELSQELGARS